MCGPLQCTFNRRALHSLSAFRQSGLGLDLLKPTLAPYPQRSDEFVPGRSILDLLMNESRGDAIRHVSAGIVEPAEEHLPDGAEVTPVAEPRDLRPHAGNGGKMSPAGRTGKRRIFRGRSGKTRRVQFKSRIISRFARTPWSLEIDSSARPMRLAIMQPYLFPYVGYFQLAAAVDRFVFLDDVQYIQRGWINRNRFPMDGEPRYFTVPVRHGGQHAMIKDVMVATEQHRMIRQTIKTVGQRYQRAPQFSRVFPIFEAVMRRREISIADMAIESVRSVYQYLDCGPAWVVSSARNYRNRQLSGQDRVIDICRQEGAILYVNPPNGRYLYSAQVFRENGVALRFLNPVIEPYPQGSEAFLAAMSILDLLMHLPREEVRRHVANVSLDDPSDAPGHPHPSAAEARLPA